MRRVRICMRPIGSRLPVACASDVSHAALRASCINKAYVTLKLKKKHTYRVKNNKSDAKRKFPVTQGKHLKTATKTNNCDQPYSLLIQRRPFLASISVFTQILHSSISMRCQYEINICIYN